MTKIKHKKGRFLLQHNCFQDRDGINLVAVLKAMGVESDQARLMRAHPSRIQPRLHRWAS